MRSFRDWHICCEDGGDVLCIKERHVFLRACTLALFALVIGLSIGVAQTVVWEQLNGTFDYVVATLERAANRYY